MGPDHTNHHATEEVPEATQPQAQRGAGDDEAVQSPAVEAGDGPVEESPPSPSPSPSPEDDLAARAAKAEEYLALAQRKQAEFENFRKRASRDAATARERGAAQLATAILPAIDNLERALQHAPADADEHGFVKGVRHVHSDLIAALGKAGIEQFSPEGEPFDPNQHEAIAQQPVEGATAGTVVEVYQRGYRAGDTVVRPARVVVAG